MKRSPKPEATPIQFSKDAYTAEYLLQNPPPKRARPVWQAAVTEYLRRSNFSFSRKDLKKPIVSVSFAQITRIYNTLLGVRNPPVPVSKKKSA